MTRISLFASTALGLIFFATLSRAFAQLDAAELITAHLTACKAEGFDGVNSVIWTGTATMPKSGDALSYELFQVNGEKWQATYQNKTQYTRETFDGEAAWTVSGQGDVAQVSNITAESMAPMVHLARWGSPIADAERYQYQLEYLGKERQGTQFFEKIKVTTKSSGGFIVYLDSETHLISMIQDQRVIKGILQPVKIVYEDYREMWGTMIAHKVTYVIAGEPALVFTFSSITFNPEVEDGRWVRPQSAVQQDAPGAKDR